MARASRAKGVAGEHEVAAIYTEHGFEVRGLEGRGDHLAIRRNKLRDAVTNFFEDVDEAQRSDLRLDELKHRIGALFLGYGGGWNHDDDLRSALAATNGPIVSLFSEVKRQERLQLWQWLAQAQSEAPSGTVPVVSFRRNRGQWYACLPLRDLLRLV